MPTSDSDQFLGPKVGPWRLSPLGGIFLTVMIDMIGFGFFLPDLQLRLTTLASVGWATAIAMASYSIAQLLTSPILGRWSDHNGRRAVLLTSTMLSFAAYILYGHATTLWMMIVARMLMGIAAGNLGVAYAYVADISQPHERGKKMGIVGMGFGIGFLVGAPLGALILIAGHDSPLMLGYAGAIMTGLNFLYIYFFLPESNPQHHSEDKPSVWSNLSIAFKQPDLRTLLIMFFVLSLGFTHLETTYFLMLNSPYGVFRLSVEDAKKYGTAILLIVGLISAMSNGVTAPKLISRFGEVKVVQWGYLLLAISFVSIPYMPLLIPAFLAAIFLSFSSGSSGPAMNALMSRNAPAQIQGGIFGIMQAVGALARCAGPFSSQALFKLQPSYPYLVGGVLIAITALFSFSLKQPPKHVGEAPVPVEAIA